MIDKKKIVVENGRSFWMTSHPTFVILLQGYLTCLPRKDSLVALDLEFVVKLTESVSQCPNMPLERAVPALGDMACVWDSEKQIHPKAENYDKNRVSCVIRATLQIVIC